MKIKKIPPLTTEDLRSCSENICEGKIKHKSRNYRNVKGQCHFTGKYRGAAHSICKLRYSLPREIPIVLRNVSNYDFHLMIKHLADFFRLRSSQSEVFCRKGVLKISQNS